MRKFNSFFYSKLKTDSLHFWGDDDEGGGGSDESIGGAGGDGDVDDSTGR